MPTKPWFGRLLAWRMPDDRDRRITEYAGRQIEIVKLTRRQADQQRTRAGWHTLGEVDGYPDQLTGHLGQSLATAKKMAEVIEVGGAQRYVPDVPLTLWAAVGGVGALPAFGGVTYVVWSDADAARIRLHHYYRPGTTDLYDYALQRDKRGPVAVEIWPTFTVPEQPAIDPIHIAWQAQPTGSFVRSYERWDQVVADLERLTAAAPVLTPA